MFLMKKCSFINTKAIDGIGTIGILSNDHFEIENNLYLINRAIKST